MLNSVFGYVEDNHAIRKNYTECLVDAGFNVVDFCNASDAITHFKQAMPDILLLDIGLGNQRDAGLQLCMEIRHIDQSVPIIFLTSHDTDVERITGLRMGADDYLTKDTNIDYILVRIETFLRRNQAIQESASNRRKTVRTDTDLTLDDHCCKATWKGTSLDLSLTQFWILQCLVKAAGGTRSHADLMNAANIYVEPNTIAAHIKAIRDCFKAISPEFDKNRTLRGIGYQWLADRGKT